MKNEVEKLKKQLEQQKSIVKMLRGEAKLKDNIIADLNVDLIEQAKEAAMKVNSMRISQFEKSSRSYQDEFDRLIAELETKGVEVLLKPKRYKKGGCIDLSDADLTVEITSGGFQTALRQRFEISVKKLAFKWVVFGILIGYITRMLIEFLPL